MKKTLALAVATLCLANLVGCAIDGSSSSASSFSDEPYSSSSSKESSSSSSSSSSERVWTPSEIYAEVNKSTVFVLMSTLTGLASGTGFFIDGEGTFVTNYHVIEDGVSGVIADYQGKSYSIDYVKGYDEKLDIAICASSAKTSHAATLGNSDTVRVGDTVYAIGYPESFKLGASTSTFTSGMVSLNRSLEGYNYIQATVNIANGNSGGPLINERGEVIGIVAGAIKYKEIDYMNLSIPISRLSAVSRDGSDTIYTVTKKHHDMAVELYVDGSYSSTLKVPYGGKVSLPSYSKTGYDFDGWYTDSSYENRFDPDSPITDPMSLYSRYIAHRYKITLNPDGGTVAKTSIDVSYGSYYTLPKPTRKGYTFLGWVYGSDRFSFSSSGTYYLERSVTLTASWSVDAYSIAYTLNGGSCGSLKEAYTVEDSFTLPTPTRTGYTFLGWSQTNSTSDAKVSTTVARGTVGNLHFYAMWELTQYRISYDLAGGKCDSLKESYTIDDAFALAEPTRAGCTFKGWYDGEKKVTSISMGTTGDLAFTAHWEIITYTVIYYANPGTNPVSNSSTYTVESVPQTLQTPTRAGYAFDGWYFDSACTDRVTILPLGESTSFWIYAKWTALKNGLTVSTSDPYEGAVSTSGEGYTDESIAVTATPLDGYAFDGWYSGQELVSDQNPYAFTMPASNRSLTAHFIPLTDAEEEKSHRDALSASPVIDTASNTATFGLYPQTRVTDEATIASLNALSTVDSNGWYYLNGSYYAKKLATPPLTSYVFNDGESIVQGTVYWFKCEPITWRILSSGDDGYSLLSTTILDARRYASSSAKVDDGHYANNYESSEIRSWLNGGFYEAAFCLDDSPVQVTSLDNSASTTYDPAHNPYACDDTNDKVYLLSYKDYCDTDLFVDSEAKQCDATDWARVALYSAFSKNYALRNGEVSYWTRSPFPSSAQAYCVTQDNYDNAYQNVTNARGVRPAITIKIS